MSFEIASSNNSLGLLRKFNSLDEFVIFYKNFIMEKIDLIHLPLKIGSQRLSKLLRNRIFIFKKYRDSISCEKLIRNAENIDFLFLALQTHL